MGFGGSGGGGGAHGRGWSWFGSFGVTDGWVPSEMKRYQQAKAKYGYKHESDKEFVTISFFLEIMYRYIDTRNSSNEIEVYIMLYLRSDAVW